MKNITQTMVFSFLIISANFGIAFAGDCHTVCDSGGACSTECPSQAPMVTPPDKESMGYGAESAVPKVSPPDDIVSHAPGNTCKYAYDGVCDDPSRKNSKSHACSIGSDESDCFSR